MYVYRVYTQQSIYVSMRFSRMKFFCRMRGKKTRYINKKHKKLVVQHQYAKKARYSKQEYVQYYYTTVVCKRMRQMRWQYEKQYARLKKHGTKIKSK